MVGPIMDKSWSWAPLSMNLLVEPALDNTELGKY